MNYQDQSYRVWSMLKNNQDNNLADHISTVYTKNKTG